MRKHLSFANLASAAALLVALTTTGAYAASQLAAKSVGEKQLRPGAVTASKLRKSAVTAPKLAAEAVVVGKLANAAVSGEKLANAAVSSAKLQDGAVSTDKLADNAATGAKVNEQTLSQVPSAARADTAAFAEAANPAAFASVGTDGSLDPEGSRGIVASERFEAGIYCLSADFTPRGAMVTPHYGGGSSLSAFARIGGGAPCPFPQVEVQIRNPEGKKTEAAFFAVLYR
jgi:hypothetical protein